MITGEHAKAAGIDRQRLVDGELRREIRDRSLRRNGGVEAGDRLRRRRYRGAEAREQILRPSAVVRIDVELGEAGGERLVEQLPRIMSAGFPEAAGNVAEHLGAVELPAPPVVAGELAEVAKEWRNDFGHGAGA